MNKKQIKELEKWQDEKNKNLPGYKKGEGYVVGESMSFMEMIEDVKRKNKEAMETHKKNGGMCQHCGKNKAEFPNGLNPFNCNECNHKTEQILKQCRKDPGFVQISF